MAQKLPETRRHSLHVDSHFSDPKIWYRPTGQNSQVDESINFYLHAQATLQLSSLHLRLMANLSRIGPYA